jgi:hypothetical protein
MAQPTLAVLDGNNNPQTIYTFNPNGQATMANSQSVAIASDQVLNVNTSSSTPAFILDGYQTPAMATWTSATPVNSAVTQATAGYDGAGVTIVGTGTITGGQATFEIYDNVNWVAIKAGRMDSYGGQSTYNLVNASGGGTAVWQIDVAPFTQFRVRLNSVLVGSGSVGVTVITSSAPVQGALTVWPDPNQFVTGDAQAEGSILPVRLEVYNGTTWDRIRSGISAATSTLTGFLNTLTGGIYNATPVTLTNGQSAPLAVDSSGTLNVATSSNLSSVSPTITASAYTSGMVIGGLLTFTGALRNAKGTGVLQSISANFSSNIFSQGLVVFFFSANPSSSTFTDKTTPAIATADAGKMLGYVALSSYTSALGSNHTCYFQNQINMILSAASSGTIYAVVISTAGVTPTATNQFVDLQLGIQQD